MTKFRIFLVKDETWVVEFPSDNEARRAIEHFDRMVEEVGREEAECWVEDIITKYGGRLV